MKTTFKINYVLFLILMILSCKTSKNIKNEISNSNDNFVIAFGSCNKQYKKNVLWKEIKKNTPNVWIWGGDNIYADTDDMLKLKADYKTLNKQNGYLDLVQNIPVMATWDDHDYGFNDSGVEFEKKKEAQKEFLDFFKVDENSERRQREGIYHSEIFTTKKGSVKVITLDTRYFRTALTKATENKKRYTKNTDKNATILGKEQWQWLTKELNSSTANFNIIVSSIQVLSAEHGFETWGNFPLEVEKLKNTIVNSKAKGVVLLSGDRHISEFSKTKVANLSYPLIDFTSSGLTHAYNNFSSENNKYRVKKVVNEISFGLLIFNFDKNRIDMQMRGRDNKLLQEINQVYP